MRRWMTALAAAACGVMTYAAARADVVPPVKGNDTGVIISYSYGPHTPFRQIAAAHCAQYGKVARETGAQRVYGGYVSYACRWVPYGRLDRPLRVRY